MIEFFKEGGWGMWPVLVLGLVMVGSAGRYVMDREPVRLRFVKATSFALLTAIALATLTDVAQVLWYISDEARAPADQRIAIFIEGMKECTRPGALGLGLLELALVLVAIGVYRGGRRELDAARA